MKYPAALVLISLLLAAGGAPDKPVKKAAPTIPADTFVTGCELILFGKDVEPVMQDGLRGYRVAKYDSTVAINGIVYYAFDTPPPKRPRPIRPEIVRKAAVIDSATRMLEKSWNDGRGEVTMDEMTYAVGDSFQFSVPGMDANVSVKVRDHDLWARYQDMTFIVSHHQHMESGEPANPIEKLYALTVSDLSLKRLIIKGRGYTRMFALSDAPRVRASLAKIPEEAEILYVDDFGMTVYKSVRIDGFLWDGAVVRDVVEN